MEPSAGSKLVNVTAFDGSDGTSAFSNSALSEQLTRNIPPQHIANAQRIGFLIKILALPILSVDERHGC